MLSSNNGFTGSIKKLSPFSACSLDFISDVLNDSDLLAEDDPIAVSICNDLQVNVLGSGNLIAAPLSQNTGYLLVDHGISQGTAKPDIWINSVADNEALSLEWLTKVTSLLVPGPELGAWRLLSSARSTGYRMLTRAWINSLTERKHNSVFRKDKPKVTPATGTGSAPVVSSTPEAPPPPSKLNKQTSKATTDNPLGKLSSTDRSLMRHPLRKTSKS